MKYPYEETIRRSDSCAVSDALDRLGWMAWFLGFGWVSRRFERQADTFAVEHLSHQDADEQSQTDDTADRAGSDRQVAVSAQAVESMAQALQHVAELNHMPVRKKSWRHGSILWRQQYLRSLVGRPVDRLSINRQVRTIQVIATLLVIAGFVCKVVVRQG